MDWLSSEESKRAKAERKEQRRKEKADRERERESEYQERSYQANKVRIDAIYDAIEAYIKRAAASGHVVVPKRVGSMFTITENNPTPKGYTWVYIRPEGNRLKATFINYGYHERSYSFRRVGDWMIGEWVKWVVERGYKGKPPR
jgi:hypothetical protein